MVLSVCTGVHIGAWTNYRLGQMSAPHHPPPYAIIWPSYSMIGLYPRLYFNYMCNTVTFDYQSESNQHILTEHTRRFREGKFSSLLQKPSGHFCNFS